MTARHPDQPLVTVKEVVRFKENRIVNYLLDHGGPGVDMNHLACLEFSDEDRQQFAQLIGYSLSGYGSLSYVSDEAFDRAAAQLQPAAPVKATSLPTPNWDNFPDATHFTPRLDDSGMWSDVFWRMEDGKAVRAWQVGDSSTVNVFLNPALLPDTIERMIARPTPEALRDAAIQDLTNLMLENPDLNQYFLARLIVDAGYRKKEAP